MNIKRISRIMVLALTLSTAGSVLAMADGNTNTNNGDVSRFDNVIKWTKDYWYVPAGFGLAATFFVWNHYHQKNVAKKAKEEAAKKKTEEAKKQAGITRQRRIRANQEATRRRAAAKRASARRRCRGGRCRIR